MNDAVIFKLLLSGKIVTFCFSYMLQLLAYRGYELENRKVPRVSTFHIGYHTIAAFLCLFGNVYNSVCVYTYKYICIYIYLPICTSSQDEMGTLLSV